MLSDLKFAFRSLAKSPGFTFVAVLSLALGIGVNTTVFSVMNAVLLATLPVKNAHELVVFNWLAEENVSPSSLSGWTQREPGTRLMTGTSFSLATFAAFQRQSAGVLTDAFAFAPMRDLNLSVDGHAEIVSGAQVASGNYHRALGVSAAVGRLLTPADDQRDTGSVAVISYRFWQQRFGGAPEVLGKPVAINGVPVTIVGVTMPEFAGAMQVGEFVDLTLPLAHESRFSRRSNDNLKPDFWWVRLMGRLKPGVAPAQAQSALERVFFETVRGHVRLTPLPGAPAVDPAKIPLPRLRAAPGGQGLYEKRREIARPMQLLMGVVSLVLLVACANVANLLLARGASRRRELAVRLALGASRARIVRQLLVESMLLATIGAVAGLVIAAWTAPALLALQPSGPGSLQIDPTLDWKVLGFATVAALATGLVFGLAPALRATQLDLTAEFQGGTRSLGGGSRSTLARSLMVVQVALSLVLVIGAGLFIRTLHNLQNVDIGYERDRLLLFQADGSAAGASGAQAFAFYERLRLRFASAPGVTRASFSRVPPLSESNWTSRVFSPDYVSTERFESVCMNGVGTDYLATLGIPLLRGRDFSERDEATAPKVAIVNQAFARKYFGHEDVVGRRIGNSHADSFDIEIVGLMRDAHYSSVKGDPAPVAVFPYAQLGANYRGGAHFAVRYTGGEAALTRALRTAAREVDASVPLMNLRTQVAQIDRLFVLERMFASLCSIFGALALLLAAVGLYGLMSYAVVRRTGEIGLRMALGALPGSVLAMIIRESLGLVVLGTAVGIAAAWGATRWISSMLFGLSATDPLTYAAAALLLAAVAFVASFLPARRAAQVDPMTALRSE